MNRQLFRNLMLFFGAILLFGTNVSAQKKDYNAPKLVKLETSMGNISLMLYDVTPKHRDNFETLVKKGFYDSLLFHRVINEFMIQGGDPNSKNAQKGAMLGMGDVGYTIPAEFVDSIKHKKGALAAARDNNPEKNSSGCQFYIVQAANGTPFLDRSYTVFGETLEGLDVVDKISLVPKDGYDRPLENVRIIKATMITDKKERKRLLDLVWKKK